MMQQQFGSCRNCKEKSCASKILSDNQLDEISKNVRTLQINKGETILLEGSFTSHVVYLRNGIVKETTKGLDGKEKIFRIFKGKTYLGMSSLFGDTVNHFSYIALCDLEVCNIEINSFKQLLTKNAEFTYIIMSNLCKENLFSYDLFLNWGQKKVYGRLADVLLFFSQRIFESTKFILPLSHQEIANFIGISRESSSRGLSELKQSGVIKLKNSVVEIPDIKKLEQISKTG